VPVLLPWIPGRVFAVKGVIAGLLLGVGMVLVLGKTIIAMEAVSLILFITVISSYLAMNFTGSTPYTSPSGVEKEMRMAIPFQVLAVILSIATWVGAMFV
jgi:hypothetical protein